MPSSTALFGGTMLAQFAFLVLVLIGGLVLRALGSGREGAAAAWTGLIAGVFGLGALVFSSGGIALWVQLLGKVTVPRSDQIVAVSFALAGDLAAAAFLVWRSGGTKVSPFKEFYFFLPVLAIFLRQPLSFVIGYSFAAGISFIITLLVYAHVGLDKPYTVSAYKVTYAVVSLGCFAVTSYVGIALEYFR